MQDYDDNEPLTLAEACRRFFGDRIKPSALRTEAAKGNLEIMQIARKDFVTPRAIREMKKRCIVKPVKLEPAARQPEPPQKPGPAMSAQAALRMQLEKRKLAVSQPVSHKDR